MNKAKAKAASQAGGISVGQLRAYITQSRNRSGVSALNPQISHQEACDIFERALEGRADEEIPNPWRLDPYSGRDKPSRDQLIVCNILRECAP